jgi:hypothetical protein
LIGVFIFRRTYHIVDGKAVENKDEC